MRTADRADGAARIIAGGMAAIFALSALLILLMALDGAHVGTSGEGTPSESLWAAAACAAGAAFGLLYAWKGGAWMRGLLGLAAWPTRGRRD